MKNRGFVFLAVLLLGVAGCASQQLPAVSTYTLAPQLNTLSPSVSRAVKPAQIIMLGRIRSPQAFSGSEIIYRDTQYGQSSYAYSRWSDTPVAMLLPVFQEALEKSGRYLAVVPYSSESQADLLLESTLLDLIHNINDDGTSDGVIRMRFNLIDNNTKRVVASRDFVARVSVPAPMNPRGAVTALNKAVTLITQDLINWLK